MHQATEKRSTGMTPQEAPAACLPDGCRVLDIQGRRLVLVGTAHISEQSRLLVREVIAGEKPDVICVELDHRRHESLAGGSNWRNLDLRQIIRRRQLSSLLVHLLLAFYQRRLGLGTGVVPGAEMMEAARIATDAGIRLVLCDRDIRITLIRLWRRLSFWKKWYMVSLLLVGFFERPDITEEDLAQLLKQDVLSGLLQELGKEMPLIKEVLIDERDTFLAEKIKAAAGSRVVAVVGAGHVQGIVDALEKDGRQRLAEISSLPPESPVMRILGWSVPLPIVGAMLGIAWTKGIVVAGDNFVFWFLVNGIPAAAGALVAWGHPFTVAAAFLSAPFTTLIPVIGVGYVTALVQAFYCPPLVCEMESLLDDMSTPFLWWKNRMLRIFLTFLLPTAGALVGVSVGGMRLFSELLR